MPTKTVKKPRPVTKAELKAMSLAEWRVLIAKDVIDMIEANRITVKTSDSYLRLDKPFPGGPKTQVKAALKKVRCTVCAVGAAFVASVNRFNAIKLGEISLYPTGNQYTRSELDRYLERFFSEEHLDLIEDAFEGDLNYLNYVDDNVDDNVNYFDFEDKYPKAADRLKAIMKNIIRNKGTFRPDLEQ